MTFPRLRHNIAALGVMQIANYLIPMTTLPYLTRVLGIESFGKMVFVQAVMAYLVLFVEFGFSWSATREIAANRGDHKLISAIFSTTWTAQWLLVCIACFFMTALVLAIPSFTSDAALYAAGMLLVLGSVLFPLWLLQGLEKLREVAVIQVMSRLVFLPFIFIFVNSPNDLLLLMLLLGMGPVLAGAVSLAWIRHHRFVEFQRPFFAQVVKVLHESRMLFLSKATISSYTTLIPLVLGVVAGPVALAFFSLADRIRSAAQSGLAPISQALFPRMSHLYKSDQPAAEKLLKRSALVIACIAGGLSLVLWFFAETIILLFGGAAFLPSIAILKLMALLPLILSLSNIFGVQIMLPNNLTRSFNFILIGASVISLILIWPLSKFYGATGAAQTILVTEAFVTLAMGIYLWKKNYLSIFLR